MQGTQRACILHSPRPHCAVSYGSSSGWVERKLEGEQLFQPRETGVQGQGHNPLPDSTTGSPCVLECADQV